MPDLAWQVLKREASSLDWVPCGSRPTPQEAHDLVGRLKEAAALRGAEPAAWKIEQAGAD